MKLTSRRGMVPIAAYYFLPALVWGLLYGPKPRVCPECGARKYTVATRRCDCPPRTPPEPRA